MWRASWPGIICCLESSVRDSLICFLVICLPLRVVISESVVTWRNILHSLMSQMSLADVMGRVHSLSMSSWSPSQKRGSVGRESSMLIFEMSRTLVHGFEPAVGDT